MVQAATTQRRQVKLDALIDAAEQRIRDKGLETLKARDLAGDLGVALGGLYNIVPDMDTLLLRVCSRTLHRLNAALSAATRGPTPATSEAATARLLVIAKTYLTFARENLRLWRALFEVRATELEIMPDWIANDQLSLFAHLDEPLRLLMPHSDPMKRSLRGRTLFSAVHGIVTIGLEERLIAVPLPALESQIEWLVRAVCHDVQAQG